jgi:phosphopantothenoylcysteine decarboxylase / phosphopantothenate---cysteine ligase
MRILVTAGPTREYLDDVRYLSNDSSGRMGYALAEAARDAGHDVLLVSGPVHLSAPRDCECIRVNTTAEMRDACISHFSACDGVIAAAAVCDYKPLNRVTGKISKTGGPITLEMIETDDVLAELGRRKERRWVLGFALEATNARENALQKLRAKNCDWIVLNGPAAIGAENNSVEVLEGSGRVVTNFSGTKPEVARHLISWIDTHVAPR